MSLRLRTWFHGTVRHRLSGAGERGIVAAYVTLLVVPLIALLGLVCDGGRAMAAKQAAATEAADAARAGAGQLSVAGLRQGTLAVDPTDARRAAFAATVAAGHPGRVIVSRGQVTVVVSYRVPTLLLGIVGVPSITVSASATAVDVAGVAEVAKVTERG
ncbi:MAG: TadG family pilus assembly protein [Actinomycetota bacterium]|jgi:Flp pilus assembly protein TadG|nr:TadG family pilus assembly protein [Actinomycetota bacterium]